MSPESDLSDSSDLYIQFNPISMNFCYSFFSTDIIDECLKNGQTLESNSVRPSERNLENLSFSSLRLIHGRDGRAGYIDFSGLIPQKVGA